MSDCCSSPGVADATPRKYRCPANGKEYGQVAADTIKHHLHQPWRWTAQAQGYYFCDDPDCEVVYFGQDDSVIEKSALRTEVGVKTRSAEALICYCYGVSYAQAAALPAAKAFIIAETRRKACACDTRNPSGTCCLASFPKG